MDSIPFIHRRMNEENICYQMCSGAIWSVIAVLLFIRFYIFFTFVAPSTAFNTQSLNGLITTIHTVKSKPIPKGLQLLLHQNYLNTLDLLQSKSFLSWVSGTPLPQLQWAAFLFIKKNCISAALSQTFTSNMCSFDQSRRICPKSGTEQYFNLQRTALLNTKGFFFFFNASLVCPCFYLIPHGRKFPHKYRAQIWTHEQGSLFLRVSDRLSLDWGCARLLSQVCQHTSS